MRRFNLTLVLLLCLAAMPASAAVIYVDLDATGANDGSSWTNAYTDLQDALAASVDGDEIWIAEGVYKPTTTTNVDISFEIDGKAVDLYGGFNGTETLRLQRNWQDHPTVLSGGIGSQTDITDNTQKLLDIRNVASTLRISGIKFQRTYSADPNWELGYLIRDCADVQFSACEFRQNSMLTNAAALVYCDNSKVLFSSCLFRDNEAQHIVGSYLDAQATVVNCTFSDNTCNKVVVAWSGDFLLYNSILYGNTINDELFNVTEADYVITGTTDYSAASEGEVMVANPLYVDDASNNFRLQAGSPAIGYGSNSYQDQVRDLQAGVRVYGDQPDAGCYEVRTASILYVDQDATGLGNGATWNHAFPDLQDALAQAIDGDTFWVAEGEYHPGNNRTDSFVLDKDLTLYGGFVGGESALTARAWTQNYTVLSGEIGGSTDSDNSYHILRSTSGANTVVIDGFVIRGGYADDPAGGFEDNAGALLMLSGADIAIRNSWITENTSPSLGGAIYVVGGSLELSGCVVSNNTGLNGGACFLGEGDQRFESTFFLNNTATNGDVVVRSGAGSSTPFVVSHCTFTGNTPSSAKSVLDVAFSETEVTFVGNILWDNVLSGGTALDASPSAGDLFDTNIIEGGFSLGTNILDVDPAFVNPAILDFRLSSSSPGLNQGLNSYITHPTDALAANRIAFGTVDLGALESDGAVPGVVYVDPNATGVNDGTSWDNAYTLLPEAVNNAPAGSTFWLAEGTHYSSTTTDVTDVLLLPDGSELYGGFDGTEFALDERDYAAHVTRISGDLDQDGTSSGNANNLLGITAGQVLLDGLTIADANSGTGFTSGVDEGAVRVNDATLFATHCIFTNNRAYTSDAVALEDGATGNFTNCLFYGNASGVGGVVSGIVGTGNVMTLTHCTLADNSINSGTVLKSNTGSAVLLYNTIVWQPGLALDNTTPDVTAHNCILSSGTDNLDTFSNIRSEDPLFVDAPGGDYSITASSNAYDSGNPAYTTTTLDLAGNARETDTAPDRGCFESLVCAQLNDDCANAVHLVLDAAPTFGSNRCATNTAGEESTCFVNDGHSVWYSFEAPATGSVLLQGGYVSKFTGTFNMRHVVFGGACGALVQLACDNEAGPQVGETTTVHGLTPGQTYYLRFDAFGTQEGRFTIQAQTAAPPAVPGVVYVDQDATGAADGSDWLNAFTTLEDAVAVATGSDAIWMAEGTYITPLNVSTGLGDAWILPSNVSLIGGFNGTESAANQAAPWDHPTILSGDAGVQGDPSDNAPRLLRMSADGATVDLFGLIMQDANGDVSLGVVTLQGIQPTVSTGSIEVRKCVFRNNESPTESILALVGLGTAQRDYLISNCLFENNTSESEVLYVANNGIHATVSGCTFYKNTVTNPLSEVVGGFSFSDPLFDVEVFNCVFDDNLADGVSDYPISASVADMSITGGNLFTEPLMVNPAAGDFTLSAASPAIGYGDNSAVDGATDLAGQMRIQGSNVDAGAFESPYLPEGCTDELACNFDPLADVDDGSCDFSCLGCVGDFNNDGQRDTQDLLILLGVFGTSCSPGDACIGDINGDLDINTEDLLGLLGVFGTSCE